MERQEYEREIIVRLFQLSNALQAYMDKLLKEEKLTTKQFFMMIIIGSFGYNPRIGEISERFGTSRQNAKQVLLKLEKNGYLKLYKDENDSRITRVMFLEKANVFWSNRDQRDSDTMSQIFRTLSLNELDIFRTSLLKTSNTIKEME